MLKVSLPVANLRLFQKPFEGKLGWAVTKPGQIGASRLNLTGMLTL
jgi:hypothetical protein